MAKIGRDEDPVTRAEVLKSRGLFQIKTWKGRPYASKWPKRRGNKASNVQRAWQAHFSYVACISKVPDPATFNLAVALSKGTGWYYRDVLASAAVGKLIQFRGVTRITTPTASVFRGTSEALTTGVTKVLTPSAHDWDNNAFWSASVNPTRLTCRSAGLYLIGYEIVFGHNGTPQRTTGIRINGSLDKAHNAEKPGAASGAYMTGACVWYFNANDYFECFALVNATLETAQIAQLYAVGITPEAKVS